MERTAKTQKILMLGVDALDPRLTRKYVDMGLMPNVKKYIEAGAQRHDLVMLGGHPTVTPPMWTTLATGCYANVHGITGFFRRAKSLSDMGYNVDSRFCKAEPLWNVFAEAGKKTLVWHWPGSAWPPTSDSENLMVVDGSAPGPVASAGATVDGEFFVEASKEYEVATFRPKAKSEAHAACVIEDLEVSSSDSDGIFGNDFMENMMQTHEFIIWKAEQTSTNMTEMPVDVAISPIKPATGWLTAPIDAKEFIILLSGGLLRRPTLILKNEQGIYDRVAIYKSKKEENPIAVCHVGELVREVVDGAIKKEKKYEKVNRDIKLLSLAEDGSYARMYISAAMDMSYDVVWHPKRLFKEVTENVGYPVPMSCLGCQDDVFIRECMFEVWDHVAEWQADAILHLIKSENLDIVFSHLHTVDAQEHTFIKHVANREFNRNPVKIAESWLQYLYVQTDNYLGRFLHLLDEGWTILIMSDHAQVASKYEIPLLFDMNGLCTPLMEEMGYTVLKRDENGNRIGEIDWEKTRAIMQREGHIYLNLKGREEHGIVDPKDKYELEEQIMTDLYSLKSQETGKRIVAVALRNKDAVLLGQGGPEAGDICVWMAEGYNYDHADSLSTAYGEGDTSVSPIFIAAGKGLKKGFETDRIIRQIDFAPTVAVLGGVRYPAQCEGAPVYQIFEDEI